MLKKQKRIYNLNKNFHHLYLTLAVIRWKYSMAKKTFKRVNESSASERVSKSENNIFNDFGKSINQKNQKIKNRVLRNINRQFLQQQQFAVIIEKRIF